MVSYAGEPAEYVDAAVGQSECCVRRVGELVTDQEVEVVLDHESGSRIDSEMYVDHGTDELVPVFGPKGESSHEVIVERPVFATVEVSIKEGSCGDAVAQRAPDLLLMAVLVTVSVLDAIHVVFLQTEESAVNWVVEVFCPLGAAVGLACYAEVKAVLRQHFHVGMSFLKRKIFAEAGVDFPNVSGVVPEVVLGL